MRWIVIEGIDGSGKSTVAELTADHYRSKGERVKVHVHPSDGLAGRRARHALESEGKVMHVLATMYYIADVLTSLHKLRNERKEYDTVIFVRYVLAATYLPERLVPAGYHFVTNLLPMPRRLLLVDVDPSVADQRIAIRAGKKEMFEDPANLSKIRWKAVGIASSNGWTILDNSQEMETTERQLVSVLDAWDASLPRSET